ncbi:MAG: sigma-70 family RNA polymerase sigma factor [Anaerohalosphaeraceae bacterium]
MNSNSSQHARFLRLYAGIQTKLFAFILSVVHNRNDAEELFQETSVILWERFETYDSDKSFASWALGIARNKVLEYLRANKRSRKLFSDSVYEQILRIAESGEDDISQRVSALKTCLQTLKEMDRKLISFRFHENIPVKLLSQHTGRSADSLYKSLSRIFHFLKLCIERKLAGEAV